MRFHLIAAGVVACLSIAGCQSSGSSTETGGLETNDLDVAPLDPNAEPAADPAATPTAGATPQAAQPGQAGQQGQLASVQQSAAAPQTAGQCAIVIAEGPPPKPAKGADFGKAVVKDTGKNVQRNVVTMIGGQLGGQLGAAVASGAASSEIRAEGDIKGTWMVTDGTPNCACQLEIGGLFKIQGKGNDKGTIKTAGCATPTLQKIANWALGYSFTGYDARFELKARDNRTVLATMNRDGVHYFSGALADGTPVVMWRDGQNYSSFKKTAK